MSSVTQNNTQLLYNMFHESLDELLLESIDSMNNNIVSTNNSSFSENNKEKSNMCVISDNNATYMELSALRDAVQATRLMHYSVQHLFHTFVLSCELFKESSSSNVAVVHSYHNKESTSTSEQHDNEKKTIRNQKSSNNVECSSEHKNAKSELETSTSSPSLTENNASSSTSESTNINNKEIVSANKVKASSSSPSPSEENENSKKWNKTTITNNTKNTVIHKVSNRRRLRRRALLLQSITNLSRMASLHLLPSSIIATSSMTPNEAPQRKSSIHKDIISDRDNVDITTTSTKNNLNKLGKQEVRSVEDTLLDLVKWLAISHIKTKNNTENKNNSNNNNETTTKKITNDNETENNSKSDKVEAESMHNLNQCRRTCTVYLIEHDDELLMRLVQLVSSLMSSASFTPSLSSSLTSTSSTTKYLPHVLGTFVLLSSAVNLSAQMETTLQAMLAQSTSLLCNFLKHTEISKLQYPNNNNNNTSSTINNSSNNMYNVAEIMHATSFMKDLVRIGTSFTSEVVQPQWLQLSLPLLEPMTIAETENLKSEVRESTFVTSSRFHEHNYSFKLTQGHQNWCIHFPISFKLSLLSFLHSYINEISIQEVHEVSNLLINILSKEIVSNSVKLFSAANVRASSESEDNDEFVWFQRFLYLALHIVSKFYKLMTASVEKMIMAHVSYLHRYTESVNKSTEAIESNDNHKVLSSHLKKVKEEYQGDSNIMQSCSSNRHNNKNNGVIAVQEQLQTQCSLIVVLINSWNHVLSNNKHLLYTLMATEAMTSSSSYAALSLNATTNLGNGDNNDNDDINSTPWRTSRHVSEIFTLLMRNCMQLFLTLSEKLSCYNSDEKKNSNNYNDNNNNNNNNSNNTFFHDKVIIGCQQSILSFVHTIFEFVVEICTQGYEDSNNNNKNSNGFTNITEKSKDKMNENIVNIGPIEQNIINNEKAMLVIGSIWSNVYQWTSCVQVALSLPFSSHTSSLFTLLCQTERLFLENMFAIMFVCTRQLFAINITIDNNYYKDDENFTTRQKKGMLADNADQHDENNRIRSIKMKHENEFCQTISNVKEQHWTMLINTLLSDNKGMRELCHYAAQINNTNENQFEELTPSHNTSETNNNNGNYTSKGKETTSTRKSSSVNNRERESLERSTLESSVASAPNKLLQLPELAQEEELQYEEEELSSSLSSQDSSLEEQRHEEEEETESELTESEREEEVESSLLPPAQTHSSSNELSLSTSETSSSSLSSSSPSLSQTLLSRLFTSPRIAHQRMQKRKIELQNNTNNCNVINYNNTKVFDGKVQVSKNDQPEHIFSLKSKWYPNEREFSELFASVQQCNGLLCLKWTVLKETILPFIWTPQTMICYSSSSSSSSNSSASLMEIYYPWTSIARSLLYMDTLLWNIHATFRTLRDLYMYCNALAEMTKTSLKKHKNNKLKMLAHDAKRTITKNIIMASQHHGDHSSSDNNNNNNNNINKISSKSTLHKFIVYTEQLKTVIETFFDKEWRKEVLHELKESRANLPFYLIRLCAENRVLGVQVLHALFVEYEQEQSKLMLHCNVHQTNELVANKQENETHTCHTMCSESTMYKENERNNNTFAFFTQATWLSRTISALIISELLTCQTNAQNDKPSSFMINLMKRFVSSLFASNSLELNLYYISNLNARELHWFPHVCAPLQSSETSQTTQHSAMPLSSSNSVMSYETNTSVPYALFALYSNVDNDGGDDVKEKTTRTSSIFSNSVQPRSSMTSQSGNINFNHASYGLTIMTLPVIFVTQALQECINNICEMLILCTNMSLLRKNKKEQLSDKVSEQIETSAKASSDMSLTLDEVFASHASRMQFNNNNNNSLCALVKDTYALWKFKNNSNNHITGEMEMAKTSLQEKKIAQFLWETLTSTLVELKRIVKHVLLNECTIAPIYVKENVLQTCLLLMSSVVHFTSQFVETFNVEISDDKTWNAHTSRKERKTQLHMSKNNQEMQSVHSQHLQKRKSELPNIENANKEELGYEEEEEEDEKDTWTLLLRLLATAHMNRAMYTTHTSHNNSHTSLVKEVNTIVFRTLESITQNYISYMTSASAIEQLILTIGCIVNTSNDADDDDDEATEVSIQAMKMHKEVNKEANSEKKKKNEGNKYNELNSSSSNDEYVNFNGVNEEVNGNVHVELSAVQMLWTVGDYIASSLLSSSSSSSLSTSYQLLPQHEHQEQRLWLALLEQLKRGVLCYFSSEIRQASLKTFFALLHTYGQLLLQETWDVIWRTMINTFVTLFTDTVKPGKNNDDNEEDERKYCLLVEENAMLVKLRNHFRMQREQWTEMRLTLVEGVSQAVVIYQRCFWKNSINDDDSNNNDCSVPRTTKSMEENITHVISRFIVLCGNTRYMTREDNTMKCEALTLASVYALRELLRVILVPRTETNKLISAKEKENKTCGALTINIVRQIWSEMYEYVHSTNTHDAISLSKRSMTTNSNYKEVTLFAHVSHNTVATIINTCVESYVKHNLYYEYEEQYYDKEHCEKNNFYEVLLQILRGSISNAQVIAQAYHYPHNVHLAVISALRLLFTFFHEGMIQHVKTRVYGNNCKLLLRLIDDQFPSIHMVKKMVKDAIALYHTTINNNITSGDTIISEREVRAIMSECLPAGSHLSFCVLLLELLEFVRNLFSEESCTITKDDDDNNKIAVEERNYKEANKDNIDVQVGKTKYSTTETNLTCQNDLLLCSVIACKANSQIIIYTSTLLLTEHLLLIHYDANNNNNAEIANVWLPESFHITCHQMYTDAVQIFINTLHNSKLETYVYCCCKTNTNSSVVDKEGKEEVEEEEIRKITSYSIVEECLETTRAFSFILYTHVHFALRLDANRYNTLQLSESKSENKIKEKEEDEEEKEIQGNALRSIGKHSNSSSVTEVFIGEMLDYAEQILLYLLTTIFTIYYKNEHINTNNNNNVDSVSTGINFIHEISSEMSSIQVSEQVIEDVSRFIEYVIEISVIANGSVQSIADHASEILHHLTTEVDAITQYYDYKTEFHKWAKMHDSINAIERSKNPLMSIVLLLHQSEVARFNYLVNDYIATNTANKKAHDINVEFDKLSSSQKKGRKTVELLKQNLTLILHNFESNTAKCRESVTDCDKEKSGKKTAQRTNEKFFNNTKYVPFVIKLVKYVNVKEQRTQEEVKDEKEIRLLVANILEQQLSEKQ